MSAKKINYTNFGNIDSDHVEHRKIIFPSLFLSVSYLADLRKLGSVTTAT